MVGTIYNRLFLPMLSDYDLFFPLANLVSIFISYFSNNKVMKINYYTPKPTKRKLCP